MVCVRRTVLAVSLAAVIAIGSAAALADGISDNVVKIGVLTDMSGQFSHESGEGAVTAVRMAIEDFGGKVLGKPIELVVADHQNKPDIASGIARKWFDVDKVDMIANLINSSIALSVSQLAKEKDRIAIINGSGASRLTGDACTPNSIHYAYDTYSLAKGTGTAMMKAGGTSWYFLTADYAFGHALEADTTAVIKSLGGEVRGLVALSGRDIGSILVPAAGAGIESESGGAGRIRHGVRQCRQGGAGVRYPERRADPGRSSGLDHRHQEPRAGSRPGAGADQCLLLGSRRRNAGMVEAVLSNG